MKCHGRHPLKGAGLNFSAFPVKVLPHVKDTNATHGPHQ